MDVTQIFCDIDDFCAGFRLEVPVALLPEGPRHRNRASQLSLSEIMTILVLFHQSSGYRNFKGYYTHYVCKYQRQEFPKLVSYNRFIRLIPRAFWALLGYLNTRRGPVTGISFVDSTSLRVCHNRRIHSHRVFEGLAKRGKTSIGWFFGFKLHLIINEQGDFLGIQVTPGNVDDRQPVPELAKGLFGKLFGDRGYISQELSQLLHSQGIELITKLRKNMKPRLLTLIDKLLLRKRSLVETVNDQLKNVCYLEHSRHRSWINAFVHLCAGLVAYTWQEKRPALNLSPEEWQNLREIRQKHNLLVI